MVVKRLVGSEIEWGAVLKGAVLGILVLAPISLAVEVVMGLIDDPCNSLWSLVFFGLVLGAFFLAGYRAAARASGSPYTHGVLGGLGAFVAWLPLRLLKSLIAGGGFISDECSGAGDGFSGVVVLFLASGLFAMASGILGGLVAARRRVRP